MGISVTEFIASIIVALGGGGALVLGLSNYLGGLLAKRYEEKVRAEFQKDIDLYQSKLDIIKQSTLRYSDRQFEFYSKLWSTLYDLKLLGDALWEEASSGNLQKFSTQLKKTKTEIEKSSLFIEEEHYRELISIINNFSDYQIGKKSLIDYRNSQNHPNQNEIEIMISHNREEKNKFEELIKRIKVDLKRQIKGESV